MSLYLFLSYFSGYFCPTFLDLPFWTTEVRQKCPKNDMINSIHISISEKILKKNFSNLSPPPSHLSTWFVHAPYEYWKAPNWMGIIYVSFYYKLNKSSYYFRLFRYTTATRCVISACPSPCRRTWRNSCRTSSASRPSWPRHGTPSAPSSSTLRPGPRPAGKTSTRPPDKHFVK